LQRLHLIPWPLQRVFGLLDSLNQPEHRVFFEPLLVGGESRLYRHFGVVLYDLGS